MTDERPAATLDLVLDQAASNVTTFAFWVHTSKVTPPDHWLDAAVAVWEVVAGAVGNTLIRFIQRRRRPDLVLPGNGGPAPGHLNRRARRRLARGG